MLDKEDILDMTRIDEKLDRQRREKYEEEQLKRSRNYWNEPRHWSPTDWSELHEESDNYSLMKSEYIRVFGLKFTWGGYGDNFYIQHNGFKRYIGDKRFLPAAGLVSEFMKCWIDSGDFTDRSITNFIELCMKYDSDYMSIERSDGNECVVVWASYTSPAEYYYIKFEKIDGGKDYLFTRRYMWNKELSWNWSSYCNNPANASEPITVKLSKIAAKGNPLSTLKRFIQYGSI